MGEAEYTVDEETFTLWTGIVLTCNSIAIQKEYYTCTQDCASCEETPFSYGVQTWEDAIGGVDTCYSNSATLAAPAADADEGVATVVTTSSWQFTEESEADEVDTYFDFILDNTCIGDGQPEIGDEEEGVECISYQDLICENPFEKTGYNLKKACAIFKDLDVSPFNSTIFVPTDTAFENFDALLDDSGVDLSPEQVGEIVLFHGTDETLLFEDLDCSAKVDMWCAESCGQSRTKCMKAEDGFVVKFQKGGGNRKNDLLPEIVVADLLTCDGNVVHIISQVMLPNDIDKLDNGPPSPGDDDENGPPSPDDDDNGPPSPDNDVDDDDGLPAPPGDDDDNGPPSPGDDDDNGLPAPPGDDDDNGPPSPGDDDDNGPPSPDNDDDDDPGLPAPPGDDDDNGPPM